jgi:hypothetical protein
MKAIIKQAPRKSLPFPKLMTDGKGLIVLMSRPYTGTIVSGGFVYPIGQHFADYWDMNVFNDFEGTVELKNEL